MLPSSPFEGQIQNFSTKRNPENTLGELLSNTRASDVCDKWIAIPNPVPYSREIPTMLSSFYQSPQVQHNTLNSVPGRIQSYPSLTEHDSKVEFPVACEVPDILPLDHGNSEASSLSGLAELDHPDSPLPEPRFNPKCLEKLAFLEAERDRMRQAKSKRTAFENHPPLAKGQAESSLINISPCPQLPEPNFIPQHQGYNSTKTPGEVTNFSSSYNSGCVRNQDVPDDSLTSISPLLHVRPSSKRIERPAKRRRRIEGTVGMTSSDLTTPSLGLFPIPSSQVDQNSLHAYIQNGTQSRPVSMPVIDDETIQRNLMAYDIDYHWKTPTDDAIAMQREAYVNFETDTNRGRGSDDIGLIHSCRNVQGTTGILGYFQNPTHETSSANGETNMSPKPIPGLPCYATLPTGTIADNYSSRDSRSRYTGPMIHEQAGRNNTDVPICTAFNNHPQRSVPIIAKTPTDSTVFLRKSAVDYHNAIGTSSDPCVFDATTTNNIGLSEISRAQLREIPEINLNSTKVQTSTEMAMEPSEQVSSECQPDRLEIGSHFIIMRLENPPECNVCGKLYITQENLEKHMKTVHGAPKLDTHKCHECQATFKNDTNLRRHVHEAHGTKNFFCNSCSAGFSTKRALVLHEKQLHRVLSKTAQRTRTANESSANTSEKKLLIYYECLLCEYSSTVKGNLTRHSKGKHLNHRPYECQYCGKRGKTKQNIAFHIQACKRKPKDTADES